MAKGKTVTVDEQVELTPVGEESATGLITLIHKDDPDRIIQVTQTQWEENGARFENDGYRHPDKTDHALTPPGEVWQHHAGTGFTRDKAHAE